MARALSVAGDLGLKTDWNCEFRVFAFPASEVNVLPFAFNDVIPLMSCLECFSKEYNFFVLTLVGVSGSSASCFIQECRQHTFNRPILKLDEQGACIQEISFGQQVCRT